MPHKEFIMFGFGKKNKIQLISDEGGNMCITDGKTTQRVSKRQVTEILGNGGEWDNGCFIPDTPGYVDLDVGGGQTIGLQPANDAAKNVVAGMQKKRGLFG